MAANDILVMYLIGDMSLFDRLRKIKTIIREEIGLWHRQVRFNGQILKIEQHFIHSPEIPEAVHQYNLLFNLTEKTTSYLSEKNRLK